MLVLDGDGFLQVCNSDHDTAMRVLLCTTGTSPAVVRLFKKTAPVHSGDQVWIEPIIFRAFEDRRSNTPTLMNPRQEQARRLSGRALHSSAVTHQRLVADGQRA